MVDGTATLDSDEGNVILDSSSNDFNVVSATADVFTIVDVNAIDIAASTIGTSIDVNAGGDITDSADLVVGTATFSSLQQMLR